MKPPPIAFTNEIRKVEIALPLQRFSVKEEMVMGQSTRQLLSETINQILITRMLISIVSRFICRCLAYLKSYGHLKIIKCIGMY